MRSTSGQFPPGQCLSDGPHSMRGTGARLMRILKDRTELYEGNGGWGARNNMAHS